MHSADSVTDRKGGKYIELAGEASINWTSDASSLNSPLLRSFFISQIFINFAAMKHCNEIFLDRIKVSGQM